MFQSIGIYAAVLIGLVALVSQVGMNGTIGGLISLATFVFIAALIWIDIDVAKAAKRVREIENIVNAQAGESLLKWETEHGLGGLVGKHLIK